MKQVFQDFRSGKLVVLDVPAPNCLASGVTVTNEYSVISPGTEGSTVSIGQKSLIGKARARPDLVRQVLKNYREQGLQATLKKVQNRLDTLKPLGYSSAGKVIRVGNEVDHVHVGDFVACAGGGYANHAECIYVPKNLCVKVPDRVIHEHAAFTTVGAIAMQSVRQAEVAIGDRVGVIGLGLIGQLTLQISQAAGARIVGIDVAQDKIDLACEVGIDAALLRNDNNLEDKISSFTGGKGLDAVIITAATSDRGLLELAAHIMRDRGRVVILGDVVLSVPRNPYYMKELDIRFSRSYGPGRYDPSYEENGHDYPIGYVRWSEQRNMESFIDLLADGRLNLPPLISHRIDIQDAPTAYDLISPSGAVSSMGIVLKYVGHTSHGSSVSLNPKPKKNVDGSSIHVGFVGAGNFAQATLLPILCRMPHVVLRGVATGNGGSSRNVATKFGFEYCSADYEKIIQDDSIDVVFVVTQHHLHASVVIAALEARKSVFVEKPLALTTEDLVHIQQVHADSEGHLLVGFNRRFSPLTVEAMTILGRCTSPKSMSYRINAGPMPEGHWVQDPKEGGRIIGEVCHFVDLLQYLAGSPATQVFARAMKSDNGALPHGDTVHASISFADGSIGSISYFCNGDSGLPKERLEVFCESQIVVIEDFRKGILYRAGRKQRLRAARGKGHSEELEAFVNAVRGQDSLPITSDEIFLNSEVTLKIVDSLNSNRPINIDGSILSAHA